MLAPMYGNNMRRIYKNERRRLCRYCKSVEAEARKGNKNPPFETLGLTESDLRMHFQHGGWRDKNAPELFKHYKHQGMNGTRCGKHACWDDVRGERTLKPLTKVPGTQNTWTVMEEAERDNRIYKWTKKLMYKIFGKREKTEAEIKAREEKRKKREARLEARLYSHPLDI